MERKRDNASRINKILDYYQQKYSSSHANLREQIPPQTIWHLAIPGKLQNEAVEHKLNLLKPKIPEAKLELSVADFIKQHPSQRKYLENLVKKTGSKETDSVNVVLSHFRGWRSLEKQEAGYLSSATQAVNIMFDLTSKFDADYILSLKSASTSHLPTEHKYSKSVKLDLQKLISSYEKSLLSAKSKEEILDAIIMFIKNCKKNRDLSAKDNQTFWMLLLDNLLMRSGFPPSVIHDPDSFATLSVDKLRNEILEGMERTYYLAHRHELYNVSFKTVAINMDKSYIGYLDETTYLELNNRLAQQTLEQVSSNLSKKIADLKPLKKNTDFFHGNYYEWHSKWTNQDDKKNEDGFKRLRLLTSYPEGVLDVTYQDGKKATFSIPSDMVFIIESYVRSLGARRWNMVARQGEEKFDWSKLSEFYRAKVIEDYNKIHESFLNILNNIVNQLAKKASPPSAYNLVDMGMGKAPTLVDRGLKEIKKVVSEHDEKKASVHAIAFDFQPSNVAACLAAQESKTVSSEILYTQGDSRNIEHIIQDSERLSHDKDAATILFSSGTMTRNTLNHGFECLNILKSQWRGPADFIIVGGESEFLFTERMLKRVGYTVSNYQYLPGILDPVFSLKRVPEETLLERLKKKLQDKPQKLDLSMSACPQKMLDGILATQPELLSKVTTLDLSCSDIADFKALAESLKSFPELKEITCFSDDPLVLKQLMMVFPANMLKIRYTKNEAMLLGSEKFFDRVHYRSPFEDIDAEQCTAINLFLDFIKNNPSSDKENLWSCYDFLVACCSEDPNLFNAEVTMSTLLKTLSATATSKNKPEISLYCSQLENLLEGKEYKLQENSLFRPRRALEAGPVDDEKQKLSMKAARNADR